MVTMVLVGHYMGHYTESVVVFLQEMKDTMTKQKAELTLCAATEEIF